LPGISKTNDLLPLLQTIPTPVSVLIAKGFGAFWAKHDNARNINPIEMYINFFIIFFI
jgi:hypothetical protein